MRVRDTYHFAYADGTPHFSVGTTCYVWNHQGDALEAQTLETLKHAPFNKMRMCVFPKDYLFNKNEPEFYPFERDAAGGWDWTRFDPAYFRHLERRVADLLALGIEADIILFHPYDRWGFATMDAETDDRYSALCRRAAGRLPQRLVVVCERVRPDAGQDDGRLGSLLQDRAGVGPVSTSAFGA